MLIQENWEKIHTLLNCATSATQIYNMYWEGGLLTLG